MIIMIICFVLFVVFCMSLTLYDVLFRIKIPTKEGVAVLVYETDEEENLWICEYLDPEADEIRTAFIKCHNKHRVGDKVRIGNSIKKTTEVIVFYEAE